VIRRTLLRWLGGVPAEDFVALPIEQDREYGLVSGSCTLRGLYLEAVEVTLRQPAPGVFDFLSFVVGHSPRVELVATFRSRGDHPRPSPHN
jgi:hypothetical protein